MSKDMFLKILMGTVVVAAVVSIIQLWVPLFEWHVYLKIIGTLGIIFLLVGLMMAIKSDFQTNKDLKDKNYLD
ncbi:MAG: hypothetical protein AAF549_07615 [Pseudomonadota bacterium]